MATSNSWTAATTTKLKQLFEKGLSTAEIGKRLGFTKNAVVGKINRLGLNDVAKKLRPAKPASKPQTDKKKVQPKPKTALKTQPDKKKPQPRLKIEARPKVKAGKGTKGAAQRIRAESRQKTARTISHAARLMGLRPDQCRWPIGDPDSDDFRFCGEKCFVGKPYCFEHCKVAYQFTASPKKKA